MQLLFRIRIWQGIRLNQSRPYAQVSTLFLVDFCVLWRKTIFICVRITCFESITVREFWMASAVVRFSIYSMRLFLSSSQLDLGLNIFASSVGQCCPRFYAIFFDIWILSTNFKVVHVFEMFLACIVFSFVNLEIHCGWISTSIVIQKSWMIWVYLLFVRWLFV